MEQSVLSEKSRHSGWSEAESKLLWETADEAQQQGLPLKQVFEQIASQTGRRPNSIRNYYYAQARLREDGAHRAARFVPFTEPEVKQLIENVLRGRAKGQSVRACLQELSGGDHSLMLRYQNKYRSVLKNRPDLIQSAAERLRAQGIPCDEAQVRPRVRTALPDAVAQLASVAREASDPELVKACEAFCRLIRERAEPQVTPNVQVDRLNVRLDLCRLNLAEQAETIRRMRDAAHEVELAVKEFVLQSPQSRVEQLSAFCNSLVQRLGALESAAERGEQGERYGGCPSER